MYLALKGRMREMHLFHTVYLSEVLYRAFLGSQQEMRGSGSDDGPCTELHHKQEILV